MTGKIVILTAPGDISRFRIEDQSSDLPGPGEIRIRHHAIGVNFIDVYQRRGIYTLPSYPAVIGAEAAGIVEAIGAGVADFKIDDRVAYAGPPVGAYCSSRNVAAERIIRLPDSISAKTAASSLLKGMTAHLLLEKVYPVQSGTTVMIHAAAGGLGSMLVRWAKSLDATVIGTVSTPEKARLAEACGADHLIVGRGADIVAEAKRLTGGIGVDVVYDGIGGGMLIESIRAIRPFGMAVTIGQVAGPMPPVSVEDLKPGKSLSSPSIMAWCADTDRYRNAAKAALYAMEKGIVSEVAGEYGLADVGRAHEDIEGASFAGSILLIP